MATSSEYAYFAGIVDGEGHVCQPLRGDGKIVLCMADVQILEWVNQRFPASYSSTWKNEKSAGSRPRRMWQMHNQSDLVALLPKLIPLLVLKAEEAEVLLAATRYRLQRAGRGKRPTPDHLEQLRSFADQMLEARARRK